MTKRKIALILKEPDSNHPRQKETVNVSTYDVENSKYAD